MNNFFFLIFDQIFLDLHELDKKFRSQESILHHHLNPINLWIWINPLTSISDKRELYSIDTILSHLKKVLQLIRDDNMGMF